MDLFLRFTYLLGMKSAHDDAECFVSCVENGKGKAFVANSAADLTFTFYMYLSWHVCEQSREE